MYFDFRTYFRFLYLAFFRARDVHFRLTPRRVVGLLLFFVLFPLFELCTAICMLLDHVLFPGFRKLRIEKPLFIVGPHRSGTTYLHRLLSRDEAQFFCFRLWEIVFPSILQKKVIRLLGRIDRKLGGRGEAALQRHEERRLGDYYAKIHKLSFFEPEEDDKLQAHTCSTLALLWFVHAGELDWLLHFDEQAREKDKQRIMRFYVGCLKRQAYDAGGGRRLLSKAPFGCLRIRSLYEYFPDCRVVYTVRNPLDAVPSMLDVARHIWTAAAKLDNWQAHQAWTYELIRTMYDYPLAALDAADPATYELAMFQDLLDNPGATVRAMYAKFGYHLGSEFDAALREEDTVQRGFQSRHEYSLDQFGLTADRVVADFEDVFERFRFERTP